MQKFASRVVVSFLWPTSALLVDNSRDQPHVVDERCGMNWINIHVDLHEKVEKRGSKGVRHSRALDERQHAFRLKVRAGYVS